MPLSLLEAMALGKVVIASRVGGIPEVIKDGKNGFLFKAGHAEELIKSGRISVNGVLLKSSPVMVDTAKDTIALDGKRIEFDKRAYYAFYKPRGVITSMSDPKGRPTVKDFFKGLARSFNSRSSSPFGFI